MICPKCGKNVEQSVFCPSCGFEFSKEDIKSINVNNNPLSPIGRIERFPYIITKICLVITYLIARGFLNFSKSLDLKTYLYLYVGLMFLFAILMLFFIIANIFAAIKRLRDIKWSLWCILIWTIPFVGIVIGAPLLFVKSRYDNNKPVDLVKPNN